MCIQGHEQATSWLLIHHRKDSQVEFVVDEKGAVVSDELRPRKTKEIVASNSKPTIAGEGALVHGDKILQ
jgi:hypothetical protein